MESNRTIFKERVLRVKQTLKEAGCFQYLALFLEKNPEYNNLNGINRVRNVMSGQLVDKILIDKLVVFADQVKRGKAA